MKNFNLLLSTSLLAAPVVGVAQNAEKSAPTRPNILYIMADDHAYQAISAYGSGLNETPNIDRIAESGVVFENSFVVNSISGPARAAILTGKFSHINGFRDNSWKAKPFDGSQPTFPKMLHAAGYQTAIFGKWHLTSMPQGFDDYAIHVDQGTYYGPDFIEPDGKKRYEGYASEITADKTIEWIENRDKEQPFMAMMHFKGTHRNWMPDTDKLTMYEDREFPVPATFYDSYENREAAEAAAMSVERDMEIAQDCKILGFEKSFVFEQELRHMTSKQRDAWDRVYMPIIADFYTNKRTGKELAEWKYQRYMRDYLKCVSSVDDNVGRVIDYLQKEGLWENTIVVYTSDQGFYLGEHGWFDKRFMYEESFRTPLLMSYPNGIKEGMHSVEGMVQSIDYAPTFLEFAGVEVPEEIQGVSFKPLLEGKKEKIHDALYYHYYEYPMPHAVKRHYGIRDDRYTLIHFYYDIDTWELYDLENDPMQLNNLIDNPEYDKVERRLRKQLAKLQKKYKDTDPTGDYVDPITGK